MANLAQNSDGRFASIQIFGDASLAPQDHSKSLADCISDQITSLKASQGGAKFILDQWLVNQGLTTEDIDLLHRRVSSKLDANLLLKWEDTYITNSFGFVLMLLLSPTGFFGGFLLSVSAGGIISALFPLFAIGGLLFGAGTGAVLGSKSHKSLDYVPTVSTVYSQLIIDVLCQKRLQASQKAQ